MPRYFDESLPYIGSDRLKPMVKAWGGDYKMRKEECINYLRAALKDPQKIQATLASLQPWERNALALIKRMGGAIHHDALKVGILTLGNSPKRPMSRYRDELTDELFRHGLVLGGDRLHPEHFGDSYYGYGIVYTDERILKHISFPEYQPIDLQPENLPGEIHFRRPASVTLDVMGLLQTLENIGGLKLTKNDTVRVSDEAKMRKAMRWPEEGLDVDGFLFPNPVQAWLEALSLSNILQKTPDKQLVLAESPSSFAQRPFGEQMLLLMEGIIRTKGWWEIPTERSYWDSNGSARQQGRLALNLALSALPLNPDGFYSLQKFESALFQRIGYDFSLGNIPYYPSFYRKETPAEQKRQIAEWEHQVRADWLRQEVPWLAGAFTTWLYFLGLIELLVDKSKLIGFRLTDVGRATFHPELAAVTAAETQAPESNQPAWVVQPNFDIIVYLDRVSPPQLAFLERHAERTEAHKHTAHYHLTRESVYRGLESNLSLDEIISTLQAGSGAELSQNILVELREWASMRERIILRRRTNLMEFSSPQALKTALAQGLVGTIVAERFLLLDSAPPSSGLTTVDYAKPLPKNLTITETGLIHWKRSSYDLITASQLNQWAAPTDNDDWQLTRESVTGALKPGRKITELLTLLNNRLVPNRPTSKYAPTPPSIPPLLELALRSWAGKEYPIELESVIVLRCPQEQVFQALLGSALIRPLLKGYQHPDLLFVKPESVELLRQHLAWLGWKVSDHLQIIQIR